MAAVDTVCGKTVAVGAECLLTLLNLNQWAQGDVSSTSLHLSLSTLAKLSHPKLQPSHTAHSPSFQLTQPPLPSYLLTPFPFTLTYYSLLLSTTLYFYSSLYHLTTLSPTLSHSTPCLQP